MHTDQLHYLIEVSKSASITAASQKLHLTPAALSISLRKLEKEMNTTLFERTSKGIALTEDGYALIKAAEIFLQTTEAISRKHAPVHEAVISGAISLMATFGTIDQFLAEILQSFFVEYPEVTVNLDEFYAENFVQNFKTSAYEVGFLTNYFMTAGDERVQYHQLFNCHLAAVFPKSDPTAQFKSVPLRYLERYGYIIFGESHEAANNPSRQLLERMHFTPAQIYYSRNERLTQKLLLNKKCTTFVYLNKHFPRRYFSSDDIAAVPVSDSPIIPFGYLTHKDAGLSLPMVYFLRHLQHYVAYHHLQE